MTMQEWATIITAIAAAIAAVPAFIKVLIEIRAIWHRNASARPFFLRNWFACACMGLGLAAILAVLMLPLSPSSVVLGAIGALFAAIGAAGILVVESSLRMIDRTYDSLGRVVDALAARHEQLSCEINKPEEQKDLHTATERRNA